MIDHTNSTQNNTSNRDQSSTKVTEEPKIRSSIPKPSKRKRPYQFSWIQTKAGPYQFSWISSSRWHEANPGHILSNQRGKTEIRRKKISGSVDFRDDLRQIRSLVLMNEVWNLILLLKSTCIKDLIQPLFDIWRSWYLNIDFCSCNSTLTKQRAKISQKKKLNKLGLVHFVLDGSKTCPTHAYWEKLKTPELNEKYKVKLWPIGYF